MLIAPNQSPRRKGLLLFAMVSVLTAGIFGASSFVFAADRAVVGELWSADN